jgi:hypothetical protein
LVRISKDFVEQVEDLERMEGQTRKGKNGFRFTMSIYRKHGLNGAPFTIVLHEAKMYSGNIGLPVIFHPHITPLCCNPTRGLQP